MLNPASYNRVAQLISYDPESGIFRRWPRGGIAGHIDHKGYRSIRIDRRSYPASSVAWLLMTGAWPPVIVDHKSRNRSDDSWGNLRLATLSQNAANIGKHKDNKSGFKGVYRHTDGRWRARVMRDGKNHHVGLFDTPEAAHSAYIARATELFGEFATGGDNR
jgi:hypothetical protein